MCCLKQGEDLDPVAALEGIFVKVFGKLNDYWGFFNLFLDGLDERLAALLDVLVVFQFIVHVLGDLVDRPKYGVEVQL